MRILSYILLFYIQLAAHHQALANLTIVSWNIRDFGQSRNDQEIRDIAQVIRQADIVAIQKVVAKDPGGVKDRQIKILNNNRELIIEYGNNYK